MSGAISITRAGPLATVQDYGRPGTLVHGISASGPMDRGAFVRGTALAGTSATSGIEITQAGLAFTYKGPELSAAFTGGEFNLSINGAGRDWEGVHTLKSGAVVDVKPGPFGNYGYVRFAAEIGVPLVMGSRSTNLIVGVGGFEGRALAAGDKLELKAAANGSSPLLAAPAYDPASPIRFVWGIHADNFDPAIRAAFLESPFSISTRLDRMGVRLNDISQVFSRTQILSLVSDAIVPGDIQILGDGTPIVLMRDHQPTGGYPRIGTVVTADLDRFAQLRPGTEVRFAPVTVAHAESLRTGRAL
jgi:biotin-dependent carboxylase-like uncharacterized protein